MQLELKQQLLANIVTECIIIGIIDKKLMLNAHNLDQTLDGQLASFCHQHRQILKQSGNAVLYYPIISSTKLKAKAILLINFGKTKTLNLSNLEKYCKTGLNLIKQSAMQHVTLAFDEFLVEKSVYSFDAKQWIQCIAGLFQQHNYVYEKFKSKKTATTRLSKLTFYCPKLSTKIKTNLTTAITQTSALLSGINLTMDLANCPPNVCTPAYLANQAKRLANNHGKLTTTVLNHTELAKLGANTLLAVGKGSVNPPKLIIMKYQGAAKTEKPTVFVGKGITFDTGGNNIKSTAGMVGMKYDMCGGATVFGVIQSAVTLKLKQNIIGVIAAAENMPDANACKPEDIITSLSGKTIEILNTDAEGRLVLADALSYITRFTPKAVIDIATLTGAIMVALGDVASGLFCNNDKLAEKLLAAGEYSGDKAWRLPIWPAYQKGLHSDYADIANLGSSKAASITAACFLEQFIDKYPWAHLDVAGTASVPAKRTYKATGRPVGLLVQYLLAQNN